MVAFRKSIFTLICFGLLLCISRLSYAETLFNDDFNANTNGWWEDETSLDELFKISNGYYYISNYLDDSATETLTQIPFDQTLDFEIETRIIKNSGNDPLASFGLTWSDSVSNSYLDFAIDGFGFFAIYKVANGVRTYMVNWTYSDLLNQGIGGSNTLLIKKTGSTIEFHINGNLMYSTAAETLSGQWFGYFIDKAQDIAVDYLKVSRISCLTTPGAVTLTAPAGSIEDTTPALSWQQDSCATWYKVLYKNITTGEKGSQWYEIEDNYANYPEVDCSNGICTVTPDVPLSNGNFEWWVRTWNSQGNGLWSSTGTFSVQTDGACAIPPGAVTLIAPLGTTAETIPAMSWNANACATWYRVLVKNTATGEKVSQWYEIEDNYSSYPEVDCSTGTCTVTLDTPLANGSYEWWILTWNDYGNGLWSSTGTFTIQNGDACGAPPAAVTLISPTGTIGNMTPVFSWNSNICATGYKVSVENITTGETISQWYEIEDNDSSYPEVDCTSGTCTVTLDTPLSNGFHNWWIRTDNDYGNGPWSSSGSFTVNVSEIDSAIQEVLGLATSVEDLSPMLEEIGTILGEVLNESSSAVTITPPLDTLTAALEDPTLLPSTINITADFGTPESGGYTPEGSTSVLTGRMVINVTNISVSETGITANADFTANNIRRDGQLILTGGMGLNLVVGMSGTTGVTGFTVSAGVNFNNLRSLDFSVNGGIGLTVPFFDLVNETLSQPVVIDFQNLTTTDYQVSGDVELSQNLDTFDILLDLNTNQGAVAGTLRVDSTNPDQVLIRTPGSNIQVGPYSLDVNNVLMEPELCPDSPTSGNIVISDGIETRTFTFNSTCDYTIN